MQNLVITFIVNISVLLQLCNMMILQIFYQKRHPSPWHVLSSTGCASLQLHARLHTLQCTTLCSVLQNCTAVYFTALCTLHECPTACPAPHTLNFTLHCSTALFCKTALQCILYVFYVYTYHSVHHTIRRSPTACPAPHTLQCITLCTLHYTAALHCTALQNFTSLHTLYCAHNASPQLAACPAQHHFAMHYSTIMSFQI